MGLGGYLMWTAVAREIQEKLPVGTTILPIESSGHPGLIRVVRSPIFHNNPRFETRRVESDPSSQTFQMVLNNPQTNYCKSDLPDRAVHRHDRHVIQQICEFYGIPDPTLKCEIYLTDDEIVESRDFDRWIRQKSSGRPVVVIEPSVKIEYGVNKSYSFDKWQTVVSSLPEIFFVHIGMGGHQGLSGDNVIDLSGRTTFRVAAGLIGRCELFVGPEGGLMHAANAVRTRSVIIITGFTHPTMTCYPDNVNIWIGRDHGPCGLKTRCDKCAKCVHDHDPQEIVSAITSCTGVT